MASRCQNRRSDGSSILAPSCYPSSPATHHIEIRYHANPFNDSGWTSDAYDVCKECGDRLRKDAERHGYTVVLKRLR